MQQPIYRRHARVDDTAVVDSVPAVDTPPLIASWVGSREEFHLNKMKLPNSKTHWRPFCYDSKIKINLSQQLS